MARGPMRKVLDLSVEAPGDPSTERAPPRLHHLDFDTATPRRLSSLRTPVVNLLKVLLPTAALAVSGLVLLWPHLRPEERRLNLKPVAVGIEDIENLRMLAPRYMGVDAQNQPYTLTAEQAKQDSGQSEVTELSLPKADITLKNGAWVAVTAEQGEFNKTTRHLDLWGGVNVFHDQGYELNTSRALVELDRGVASGNEKVRGQGPGAELEGDGFRILDRGARVIVTGRSRLVLDPDAKPAPRQTQP